jgi:transposase
MRLKVSKSKNSASLYVIKSIYNPKTQSNTSVIVEKLGTEAALREKLNGQDPYEWAKTYIKELNEKEKLGKQETIVKYSNSKQIPKGKQVSFNGGYLFLQQIYYELGLDKICNTIAEKYNFTYDLNSILSRLIFSRIIYPNSKLATFESSMNFIEQPNFELHHIYRALDIIAKENDYIQSQLYKNSSKVSKRNKGILYYDCTNFFFEIAQSDGLKQYGRSKENRPNPIVQMGLFMDGNGLPLAFDITPGNTNEQVTLKPLEEKLHRDFKLSKFVVCTDAGLSSMTNRKYNDKDGRAFITTQSIKKLKAHLKEWAIDPNGWYLQGDQTEYNIEQVSAILEELESKEHKTVKDIETIKDLKAKVFYKERWIDENNLEQRFIVTHSFKFRDYQRHIRYQQIERAVKLIESNPKNIGKARQNDFKRLIKTTNETKEGEKATKKVHEINAQLIENEAIYDGFYGVCTNLEDDIAEIIRVNKNRWQIEESFRIMKSEFKARPVYLKNDNRILAHFITCFIALMIYRILNEKLKNKYTCSEIITTLQGFNFLESHHNGYIPTYKRDDLTDDLHEYFGFRTDFEIVDHKKMRKILKHTKK